jgi:hypothetical protein
MAVVVRVGSRRGGGNFFQQLLAIVSIDTAVGILIGLTIFLTIKTISSSSEGNHISVPGQTSSSTRIEGINKQQSVGSSTDALVAPVATVAFAVSVTGCGSDPVTEGGAVLQYSIHRASSRGRLGGKYDYALFAIYHPQAESCAMELKALGYTMLKRETPVAVSEIQGEYLRSKIESNGCCGEKELIKLEAYTLTDYPIVVHLDLDVLVLKPMDPIFDLLMNRPVDTKLLQEYIMWKDKPVPESAQLQALFTMDYNMVGPSNPYKPVQGGFLVLRPDKKVYEEFRDIIRKGDFREHKGWGGLVGPFHGSMTFQGLIPYYYNVLHPGHSIELNRCVYNQMADNPRTGKTVNDVVQGQCRTGEADCPDCRSADVRSVVTTHFTLCQKPWTCLPHEHDMIQHRLCRKLTHEWYAVRSELEQSWGRTGSGTGDFEKELFFGWCTRSGGGGYIPIQKPYGPTKT